MRVLQRISTAVVMALMVLNAVASPVFASVTKSGTKSCILSQYPYARSYSTGQTEIYPPQSGYGIWQNGSTWTVRYKEKPSPGGGGFWFVEVTNGSLSDSGTYAGCTI